MNHVSLDHEEENVKRFFLSLSADPGGSMVELQGRVVACVVPASRASNGSSEGNWTDAKNARRAELIKRKHATGLAPAELVELAELQEQMLRYRQKVAPLPLEDARRLHEELLARVAAQKPPP